MIPDDTPKTTQENALELLTLQQQRHESNQRLRPYIARIAHQSAGLTHREIGEVYGITEAAVRAMIKRSAI